MWMKFGVISALITGIFIISGRPLYMESDAENRELRVQKTVLRQVEDFRNFIRDSFYEETISLQPQEKKLQQAFLKARLLYKKFEWASTYFASDLSDRLNGPPDQEIENADLLDPVMALPSDPMGLQVIEEYVFPTYDPAFRSKLADGVSHLVKNTEYLVSFFQRQQLADWRVLDAAKLEVFRVITLGITGYDNPLSLNSMEESATALQSLRKVISLYAHAKNEQLLLQQMDVAIQYLRKHPDFDLFDRADFIIHFANPISTGIARLEQKLSGEKIRYNRMLNQNVRTLFDSGAFNVNAFSPGPGSHITDAKVRLGEKLFFDKQLSGTRTRSCASCHQPQLDFTDGLAKNKNIRDTGKLLTRNVPTLLNAALQSNYFYDMRALTLEDQVVDVIHNKHEMDGSLAAITKYVVQDKAYMAMFAKAYPKKGGAGIESNEVANALASYVRSLVKLNSRFDDYMRGNERALTPQELRGFNLFMGKAKCATCHFMPLFNGMTPPKYIESETEVIGVPASLADSSLDVDQGYYDIIGVDSYRNAFKTPSVRNMSKTAPYMHNGVYRTLEEVMDFYNNAGAMGLGFHLPNQTLPEEPLELTEKEKQEVILFMKSLDSR